MHTQVDTYTLDKKITGKHVNLLAFDPNSKKQFILLQGHIDTVPTLNNKILINEKEIIGRGSVDMKGPLAGIIDAFVKISKNDECKYSPMLLVTADEESNSFAGINHFVETRKEIIKNIKIAVNGEPTNFEVYTKFRGIYGHNIQIKGVTGHSAYPAEGTVIEKTLPLINDINNFIQEAKKIKDDSLGNTIGAFTLLSAGNKINQLPSNCVLGYALRTVVNSNVYENLFQEMINGDKLLNCEINKISVEPIEINVDIKINTALNNSFVKINKNLKYDTARYFSEANILNRNNIQTITIGPGNPQLAHVEPSLEKIAIEDIKKYSKLIQTFFSYYK